MSPPLPSVRPPNVDGCTAQLAFAESMSAARAFAFAFDSIAPVVGTDTCYIEHYGYALSGQLRVRHSDGSETIVGPGDAYHIGPDHLGEVYGDEPFETIEFLPTSAGSAPTSAVG